MEYTHPLPQFHVLQSDIGPVGFSFASVNEAKLFKDKLKARLEFLINKYGLHAETPLHTVNLPNVPLQSGIFVQNASKVLTSNFPSLRLKDKKKKVGF